jgi:heme-degrading monooxygenase HmoA
VIVRVWRAVATRDGAERYREHFTRTVLPELGRTPGFLGAWLTRRDRDSRVELQVLTRWESPDAVRGFAGDAVETAVVEPEARAVLLEYDSTVTHHTVVVDATPHRR